MQSSILSIDHDYSKVKNAPKVLAAIGKNKKVLFSDKVEKINENGWSQKRLLLITEDEIFNIKDTKVKRAMNIKYIDGISKNIVGKKHEFAIHINSEYDYRFQTEKREIIIKILQLLYIEKKKKNLPIFVISEQNLKGYTTTEKDRKKGMDRFPPVEFRDKSADLQEEEDGKTDKGEEGLLGFDDGKKLRDQQFAASKNYEHKDDDGGDDDEEVQQSIAIPSQLMFKNKKKGDANLEDFQIMRIVGEGTFGKVYQVLHTKTNQIYAMKCIRKDVVIENEQYDSLKLEKQILYNIDHPFIVSMDYVFQNQFRIFFIMDFIEGGELFRHLVKVRRFPEEQARFMIAQVAIALGHLHEQQIVYRDLKPENVLFNKDGYLLLADFGLATKVDKDKLAMSFCGTAEYLSPEMIEGTGHDHTVDWWTLGILLYEMLVGIPPFFHKNKHKMYFLIKEANVTYPVPEKHNIYVSPDAQDLINKLLHKKKDQRLGVNGIKEILEHQFFKPLDIDALLAKKIKPEYMPEIKEGELKFFNQRLVQTDSVEMSVVPTDKRQMISQNKKAFENF